MNPGAAEEVGKSAGIFMQIMKDQPLSLALVIMNLCLLGFFFYVAKIATENRQKEFSQVMESQKEVQHLLYNCVPSDRRGGEFRLQSDESHPVTLPPVENK